MEEAVIEWTASFFYTDSARKTLFWALAGELLVEVIKGFSGDVEVINIRLLDGLFGLSLKEEISNTALRRTQLYRFMTIFGCYSNKNDYT